MGGDAKMMGGGGMGANPMPSPGAGNLGGYGNNPGFPAGGALPPPGPMGTGAPGMGGLADMFRSLLGSGGQTGGGAPIATQPTGPAMPSQPLPPPAPMGQPRPQEAPKWGPRDQWVRDSHQLSQLGLYGRPERDIARFKMENPSLFSEAPPRPTGMADAITGSVSPKFPSQSQLLAQAINDRYR